MWRRSWIAILALIALIASLWAPLVAEAHSVPTPPVNLIAEIVEGKGVALTWDAPSEDAESVTGYQILRRLPLQGEPRPTVYVADTGSTETTYTDEDATAAGEQYNYRVKALRGDEESRMSNLAEVVIPQAEPEPLPTEPSEDDTSAWTEQQLSPQVLIAKAGAGFVRLSWDAPVGDAESVTGYEVSRRRANRGEAALKTLVADTGATDTSFADSTANEEGVFYEYRVRARRGADASGWSNLAAAVGQEAATIESPDPESARQTTARRAAARFQPQAHVPSKDFVLSFFNASHAHVSQIKVVGIHMTGDLVYIGTTGGGTSAVWKFGRSAALLEQHLPLEFAPRGLTASSAHLYVLDASGTAHAYDLGTLSPVSSYDITFALHGTDNPAASLRGVHALAAHGPGFTGPDSGMGLVYAARRFDTGVEKWEVVGPPGVGVHPDELGRLGITNFDGADVATDLSTHLFVEDGTGDGVYVFELQSSGSAELSERPELLFGRNGHDGLYYDGSLLWTLDVESYEWDQHAYTLTLRAYDPERRTDWPDPLPTDLIAVNCGIKSPVNVEDIDDPDGLLLPDLVSCPAEYSSAEVISAPDGAELYALRFAGYVTNLGAGPLDLKGNPQLTDDADPTSYDVWQRALTGDGEWVTLATKPPIIFQQADGHNHFHVMGIVEYSLWDASGTVEVSSGSKVGFCLADMWERPDLHLNPSPKRYDWTHGGFCQTNDPGATTLHMGISEGWQDVYVWNAAFQWVDVSDVRPGYYRLGQRVDAENVIVESDETNNGLKLSHRWHVVPGYAARPATVRVDPGATVRFKLGADEYFDDGSLEDESTRAHRIVTQPSHGRLDVGDTITVTIDGVRHQAFTDKWVTYTPDPSYAGSDSFTFVALDESRPEYPINPVVAKVTLHVVGLDNPASGEPIIEGIAEVGRTLTASTSEISDSSGVDNTTYSYQWIRNDGTADMDIPGATSFQYPLTIHDLGSTIAVRVNFRDDLGFQETLTSGHTSAVVALSNKPASGAPIIGGLDSYGRRLHLDMSDISDDDGLANVTYSYQWIRNDGTADTDIPGATSSTYAVRRGDHRKAIAVRVSFVDDMGFSESLTSELTSQVSFPRTSNLPNFAPTGAPTISGVLNVGETLTADTSSISDMNNLESAIFSYRWIAHDGTRYRNIPGARSDHYVLTTDDVGKLIAVKVIFIDDSAFRESLTSEPTTRVLDTSPRPGTGAPIIHGTAEVGETLTADTSEIWDTNGLDVAAVTYHWISNDGTADADIPGATSSVYTLTTDDVGKTMKVRVTFTDDAGNEESLTSAATDTVEAQPNTPATGEPSISGTARVGETLTSDTSGIADADGLTNASYNYQWLADDGNSVTGIAGATGSSYTVQADDEGSTIQVMVSFTDDAGNDESLTSAATDTVSFAVQQQTANSPATGQPSISGTAQVGETLTADTSGIADADGLTNASYNYQWLADGADIAGATATTYTLTDSEQGKTVKVRVSFTDDAGNEEELTSAATAAVVVAEPAEPPAMPTGLTAAPSHDHVVLSWDDPQDDTITGYVILRRNRATMAVGRFTELVSDTGSAATTYTDYDVEGDASYTYKIRAINEHGVSERSRWVRADTPAPPLANSPATGEPTISGLAQVDETLTADTSGISDVDGLSSASYSFQWLADDAAITGATATTYTLTDSEQGKTVKVRVSFTDDAGHEEELTSAATGTVEARPNSPATGQPTISGTVQVGETLTADTSGIADEDGLTSAVYQYQWLADGADIAGANATIYTLTADDDGAAVEVRVSFTDDAGNDEELTSAATAMVESGQPTGSAPDAPRKPDGTAVFIGGVDLEWDDVPGADAYQVQQYRSGQWTDLPGDGVEIAFYGAGAIVSGLDPQSSLWFQVRAANAHGVSDWSGMLFMNATRDFTLGRRARPANVTATGAPVIMGAARVGETLRADTTGIGDGNGLDRVRFEYQWTSNDGGGDTDKAGATQPTYVWSDDEESGTVSVRVSFVDRIGYAESLNSAAVGAVVAQQQTANNPATGQPTISGTAQVGETLTADTSGIADQDGLNNVAYSYQWLADDGNSVTEIAGATGSTYTLVAADEGRTIKVQVSFTDDAENEESLTSAATDTVEARPNSPATGAPAISGTAQVGETLTADTSGIADADGLTNASYSYQWIANDGTADTDIAGATDFTYTLADADEGAAVKVRVSFTDDAGNEEELTSAATGMVEARPNSPATGEPTISGTAQVGETLTADTSGIADNDGLTNASYSYQWLADGADIAGAHATTYILTADDVGAIIKVTVSLTDDAGNEEELTSAATGTVEARPNSPATGEPTISGTAQVGETLTPDTSGIADNDGLTNASYSYQWLADGADIAGAMADTYTLTDSEEGKTVQVTVSFTDDAGHAEELTSSATGTVEARPNTPATGAPTITGTAQVGETLTADTSGIADTDGLSSVSHSYQWLADDVDIAGATDSTYTVTDSDEVKTIKVRVSFTDDAGHAEELTSKATRPVVLPLTGSLHDAPESHDGRSEFTFELLFSENVRLSYKKLRDHAFTVTGGTVQNAQRMVKSSNIRWRITVEPDSDSAVHVLLPETTRCGSPGGICASGKKFSSRLELTVAGPGG